MTTRVYLEIEFDGIEFDREFSITQQVPCSDSAFHRCHHASRICSLAAIGTMGQCVGLMIARLVREPSDQDVVLKNFGAIVARSARNPSGYLLPRTDRLIVENEEQP